MNKKLVFLAGLLAIPIAMAQRFGSGFGYYGYGGSFLDLENIYFTYPYVFDFLVFFLIFAGVSRIVFTKLFGDKGGAKALYIGVGLALSIGGVFFGYLSLETFGQFGFIFFTILLGVTAYSLMTMSGLNKWVAAVVAIASMLFGAPLFAGVNSQGYGVDIFGRIPSTVYSWPSLLGILLVIGLFVLVSWLIRNREKLGVFNRGTGNVAGPRAGNIDTNELRRDIRDDIRSENENVQREIDNIRDEVGQFNQGIDNIEQAVDNLINYYSRMGNELEELRTLEEHIKNLEGRIGKIENAQESQETLAEIEKRRKEKSDKKNSLELGWRTARNYVGKYYTKLSERTKSFLEVMGDKIKSLRRNLSKNKDGIAEQAKRDIEEFESVVNSTGENMDEEGKVGEEIGKINRKSIKEISKDSPDYKWLIGNKNQILGLLAGRKDYTRDYKQIAGEYTKLRGLLQGTQRKLLTAGDRQIEKAEKEKSGWEDEYAESFAVLNLKVGTEWRIVYKKFRDLVKMYHPEGRSPNVALYQKIVEAKNKIEKDYRKRGLI